MSDLAATNCGCDCGCGCDSGCSTGCGCNNNCGCNNGCFEKATWYSEVPGLSYTQIKTAARKKEGTGSWLSASDPGHFPPFHPEQYVR